METKIKVVVIIFKRKDSKNMMIRGKIEEKKEEGEHSTSVKTRGITFKNLLSTVKETIKMKEKHK